MYLWLVWKQLSFAIFLFKNIAFFRNCLLCLFWACFWLRDVGCLLWFFLIERFWIVFSDCLIWLIVPVGCFLLNGCDFVRKKRNYGRTVHCNAAVVKPCVKKSACWFRIQAVELLILVDIVCCENVFLFWTSFCERHKLNRLSNSDGYCSCVEETQRVVRSCFNCVDFMAQTVAA